MPEPTVQTGGEAAAAAGGAQTLLAGRFKEVPELERGYTHQFTETQKIIKQRDELAQKLEAVLPMLEAATGGVGNGRVMPADRMNQRRSAIDTLAESTNVPREQIVEAIAEVTAYQLAPLTRGVTARQTVAREAPDFIRFEAEVAQFLQANPPINERFTRMMSDPDLNDAALKYAFLEWSASKAGAMAGRTDASGTDAAAEKLDAAVPASGAAGRSAAEGAGQAKAVDEARAKGERGDGWGEWLRLKLDGVIPESHYLGK